MGPLLAHIEIQANSGAGFDPLGNGAVLNAGYVQWAGITAGKHGSFYDYLAGGDTWKDFFSPDHSGTPINLLAYTATLRRRLLGHRVVGAARERPALRRDGRHFPSSSRRTPSRDGRRHADQRHGARRSRA